MRVPPIPCCCYLRHRHRHLSRLALLKQRRNGGERIGRVQHRLRPVALRHAPEEQRIVTKDILRAREIGV